jgi:phospholipid/cholesterol/gamma-HCH transport system substrate-binding protein
VRRLTLVAAVLAAAALATLAALPSQRAYGGSSYTVDALFDTASGLIPLNNVEIAGAKVGTVTHISLTSNYLARVQMTISERYAPFHVDARCQIRPVALIGEMEVNCDPGTAAAGPLRPANGQPPTVGVAMTTVPVDLTDLFDIWTTPVSQRLSIVLWTLGAGLAGRGQDLNSVLQRSNPTLMLARETITTLDQQRAQLQSLLDASDEVLSRLAPQRAAVSHFIDAAAAVSGVAAAHGGSLASAVQRLPALLAATKPALQQFDDVAIASTPVLSALHASAPNLDAMVGDVVPLVRAALPAVTQIGDVARTGLRVNGSLTPLAARLSTFAHIARPVASLLGTLFTNMQQRGFVEGLNSFPYYVGSSLSRFDATSHLSASNFLTSLCGGSDESGYAACSARWTAGAPSSTTPARRGRTNRSAAPGVPAGKPVHPTTPPRQTAPAAGATGTGAPSTPPAPSVHALQSLLNYLLK